MTFPPIRLYFFLWALLLPGLSAQAVTNWGVSLYDTAPQREVALLPPLCHEIFSDPFLALAYHYRSVEPQERTPENELNFDMKTEVARGHTSSTLEVSDRIIRNWVDHYDYNEAQGHYLRKMNASLDPRRVMYLDLSSDTYPSALRIFDGSESPLKRGIPWDLPGGDLALTPIERSQPGFLLPERASDQGESSPKIPYVWEFGLLDTSPELASGVTALFGHAADLLDLHYNGNHQFQNRQDLSLLQSRHMMIYAQTRADRVPKLLHWGFKHVMVPDGQGEERPFEISKNLYLMSFKAEDFLERYSNTRRYAKARGEAADTEDTRARERKIKRAQILASLDAQIVNIPDAQTLEKFVTLAGAFYYQARVADPLSERQHLLARKFFELYYILLHSLPADMHFRTAPRRALPHEQSEEWRIAEYTAIQALESADPSVGLYAFAHMMDAFFTAAYSGPGQVRMTDVTVPISDFGFKNKRPSRESLEEFRRGHPRYFGFIVPSSSIVQVRAWESPP